MTEPPYDLDAFGLQPDEPIRWRRRSSQRWKDGYARGVNDDGSLRITDLRGGGVVNLLVDRADVERFEKGPRGGLHYIRIERAE